MVILMNLLIKIENMEYKYIKCDCTAPEHTLIFTFDEDKEYGNQVYVHVFLDQPHNVFKRTWFALKYILNFRPKWGQFSETCLSEKQIEELRDEFTKFLGKCK